MEYPFKRLLTRTFAKETLAVTVWEITKFVFEIIIASTAFVFLSHLLTTVISSLSQFKIHFGILFGTGGALLFMVLYERLNRFRPKFPRLGFDFLVSEIEISYEYKDRTHMTYRKKRKLKALKGGLEVYQDKYRWTGDGQVLMRSAIREQTVYNTMRKSVWQFYEVRFEKTLAKGETIETDLIWDLEDSAGIAVPFFSATVEEPTDLLKMNLNLNPALGVKQVTCEISSGIGAKRPFQSETRALDKHGEITWLINKPRLLYHYEMKWVFSDAPTQ